MNLVTAIKNILKRILPPPVHSFMREITGLRQLVTQLNEGLRTQQRRQEELTKALTEQQRELAAQQRQFEERQQRALEALSSRLEEVAAAERESSEKLSMVLEGISGDQKVIRNTQEIIYKKLEQVSNQQGTDTAQLQSALKQVESNIPNKPIYWSNAFERSVVEANWGDVTERPDFAEKFIKLTYGMDAKSIETIIRIIARQKQYLHSDKKTLDLFTRAEQEELRLLKENFNSEILKLSDHLFAYKNYLLPINHFESSVFYFKHGLDEVETLDTVKGKAIVDVGGFVGDSVLVLSELNPSEIYTFEAVPENFELLKKTVELNHVPNVVAENVGLGAEPGSFTIHVAGSSSTSIDRPGMNYKGNIEVPVITLDDYVAAHQIEIGLIKVDIEGGEPAFLAGAKKTICEQKPILLLSIYHNAHDFFELKPLIESWGLGYRFRIHKPTYGNATSETLLLAEVVN